MRFDKFIFDLDGTVVDSRPAIEMAAQIALAQVLPNQPKCSVTSVIGPPIRTMFKLVLGDVDDAALEVLTARFRAVYDDGICFETVLYDGIAEVLDAIFAVGGISYLVTNKPYVPTMKILSLNRIASCFAEVLSPDSPCNPFVRKADGVSGLIKRNGLSPASVLMIGDSMDDAEAAQECGVAFAAAIYGYGKLADCDLERRKAWVMLDSPLKLMMYLPH